MRTHHPTGAIREVEERQRKRFRLPAIGLFDAMKVTLRAMLSRAVTVHYPDERMELPPRTRGVIALLEENCTVCMLCAKECPCWCIYIEGHKEQRPGKRKAVNALDRFAIDYGLCMYCGICVEVCPFDALHWSPFFEYTSFTYEGMVHESEVLQEWEHVVLPPPELVDDADEAGRKDAATARAKREDGIWAVIREADKKEAWLAREAAAASTAGTAPAPGPSSDTLPEEAAPQAAVRAPASPVPAPEEAPAPQAPEPPRTATAPVAETTPTASAADLAGVPRIDPTRLPDGISAVERGRLKKLGVLQERGQAPPADLVDNLRHLFDRL